MRTRGHYDKAELDAMEREADARNAAAAIEYAKRSPIATALAAELEEAMKPAYYSGFFDDWWGLLGDAWRYCKDAQNAGRDLQVAGEGLLDAWDIRQVMTFARGR